MSSKSAIKQTASKNHMDLEEIARNKINKLVVKVKDFYFHLQLNQRLYVNSFVLLLIFFVAKPLLGKEAAKGFLFLFFFYWTFAIGYDLIALYKKVYETVLGKALLAILFTLSANIGIVMSSQVVNEIVGGDPSKFPHTITLLSILIIPLFVVAGFGILSMVLTVSLPIFMIVHTIPDEKTKEVFFPGILPIETIPYPKITRVIQIFSFAVFCGVVYASFNKSSKSYETFLTDTARSFLYQFEMYSKSSCKFDSGSRMAYLGDGKILVGSKNNAVFTFKERECTKAPVPSNTSNVNESTGATSQPH